MKPYPKFNFIAVASLFPVFLCSCTANVTPDLTPASTALQLPVDASKTYVYACPDGMNFTANIQPENAWLFLPGETIHLPQVPSGSGARYFDDRATFWSKGQEAYLKIDGSEHKSCINNPQRAVWEHAKLRGVDFRAVGNEPGWHLEIRPELISYVTDYGNTSRIFARPQPTVDQSGRRVTYLVHDNEDTIHIQIEGRPCQDSMSGEEFEATVTIRINDTSYRGCGRPLH